MDAKKKLWAIFNELAAADRVLLTDTFTLLCYVHLSGDTVAANKLMRDLFNTVNIQRERLNLSDEETLLNTVLNSLDGNQKTYGLAVSSRAEIANLLHD